MRLKSTIFIATMPWLAFAVFYGEFAKSPSTLTCVVFFVATVSVVSGFITHRLLKDVDISEDEIDVLRDYRQMCFEAYAIQLEQAGATIVKNRDDQSWFLVPGESESFGSALSAYRAYKKEKKLRRFE